MAGFSFGKSNWDNIPQTLGLSVEDGVMKGLWQGSPVRALFGNVFDQQSQDYSHYTRFRAMLEPPLGLEGLENGDAMKRIVDPGFLSSVEERTKMVGLYDVGVDDTSVYAEHGDYVSNPEFYRSAFDTLTWAAKIVMERRAKNPPEWERTITAEWPALAQAWNLRFDARSGVMEGDVGGRVESVRVFVQKGEVSTYVQVATPMPAGHSLALTRQKSGFFSRLFRGQDIKVGDPAFDDAFVIKGEPEEFVRATLTPAARKQILDLTHAGASITLQNGWLAAWVHKLVTNRAELDALMKAAYLASEALCPRQC